MHGYGGWAWAGGCFFISIADMQACTLKSHGRAPACHQTPSTRRAHRFSLRLFEDGQAALATQAAAYEPGHALGMDTRVLARVPYLTTLTQALKPVLTRYCCHDFPWWSNGWKSGSSSQASVSESSSEDHPIQSLAASTAFLGLTITFPAAFAPNFADTGCFPRMRTRLGA